MDDEHTLRDVDTRVRCALRPDASASRRVVLGALADDHGPVSRAGRRRLAVVVVAALALAAGASVWQWRRAARTAEREPFRRAATDPLPAEPTSRRMNGSPSVGSPDAPSLVITGRGSLLVVDGGDGRRWVVGPAPDRRTGGNYVIVLP